MFNQSGLPPLVRVPTMSNISFTAAVRPASGPCGVPRNDAVKSCGTKAVWDRDNVGMRGSLTWRVTFVVIIVNNVGHGRQCAGVGGARSFLESTFRGRNNRGTSR